MSVSKVKIGVVGAGSFTELWYLPVLERHPAVRLQAICSASGTSAEKLAEKYSIPSSYRSYRQMFQEEELDGICIVSPNETHHDIAKEASRHGIHVMCEKPLAMNGAEACSMLEATEENGIIHGVNFTYRGNPAVKKLKELLQNGSIGQIYEGKFQYTGAYGLSGPPGWRGSKSIGGDGGVLADLGSHLIDVVQYVLSENVRSVQASLTYLHEGKLKRMEEMVGEEQSADSVFFNASFPSGAHGSFFTSWVSSQGNRHQTLDLSFHGSNGAIQLLASELGLRLQHSQGNGKWQDVHLEGASSWDDEAEPSEERFRPWRITPANEIWKWADAILARKSGQKSPSNRPDFNDGYTVQKVMDAVLLSAQRRAEVIVLR